ncbi:MAG: histidine kinase [Bacteroidales bacterium]|nr:histidine kinase [Bacteroidales bacterium]
MKRLNDYGVILLFALLHLAVSILSRLVGFHNELALTLLTMILSVCLSLRKRMGIPFMVIAVILVNFAGLYLGRLMGEFLRFFLHPAPAIRPYIISPLATFLTTGIVGLVQLGCSALVKKSRFYKETPETGTVWLIFAFVTILVIRLIMTLRSSTTFFSENVELNIVIDYVCSFAAVLWMASYTLHAQQDAQTEKKKRHEAQYSYERLKQQIEPHFLFNSLNSLDSIVVSGQNVQASQFIHKLSGIYRYLIETEDERLVYLDDELRFVRQFIDLMKVRFPEGLQTEIDIEEDGYCHFIIPCSLQLLVENATKHNTISGETPLRIRISIEGDYIQISNNRNPKISSQPSTGNGQRYIRQRYRDEAGKEILVTEDEQTYTVKLPLL